MPEPQIVAAGGGGFCRELARHIVELAGGGTRTRVLYVGTASAEDPRYALEVGDLFGPEVEYTRAEFFPWPRPDLEEHLLRQDAVFVDGGNTANMLAVWRVHGFDRMLRRAWEQGVVLSGSSAGGICWFDQGVTDSFGPQLDGMDCLGFLQGSLCPHYDDEDRRRPVYHELLQNGMRAGYAAEAGVGLHFVGEELREVVSCREGSGAFRVELVDGEVRETRLEARHLG